MGKQLPALQNIFSYSRFTQVYVRFTFVEYS